MTLNDIFNNFPKIFKISTNNYKNLNRKYFVYLSFIVIFFFVFISISYLINKKNNAEKHNFDTLLRSSELLKLSHYFISTINSPYEEIKYIIQNNDSIEKILKRFEIKPGDIKIISNKLKQKNLSNIYAGRKLELILKKLDGGAFEVTC